MLLVSELKIRVMEMVVMELVLSELKIRVIRFPYEIVCFLLHIFLTRFYASEISCFLAVIEKL
jgi:hypothetical protein